MSELRELLYLHFTAASPADADFKERAAQLYDRLACVAVAADTVKRPSRELSTALRALRDEARKPPPEYDPNAVVARPLPTPGRNFA